MKRYIVFSSIVLFSFSCKKEKIIEFSSDYRGNWMNEEYLKMDGSGIQNMWLICDDSKANLTSNMTKGAGGYGTLCIKKNKLKFKGRFKTYIVDEPPVKLGSIGDVWRMKIDGITMYCDKSIWDYCGYSDDSWLLYHNWNANSAPTCSIWNYTNSDIVCTVNGVSHTILMSQGWSLGANLTDEFGDIYEYSDNVGNTFTYHAVFNYTLDLY